MRRDSQCYRPGGLLVNVTAWLCVAALFSAAPVKAQNGTVTKLLVRANWVADQPLTTERSDTLFSIHLQYHLSTLADTLVDTFPIQLDRIVVWFLDNAGNETEVSSRITGAWCRVLNSSLPLRQNGPLVNPLTVPFGKDDVTLKPSDSCDI